MTALEIGQVRTEGLGRRFKLAATGGRSLRGTLLGYDKVKPREFWALRGVDLDIAPGEAFGIVGRNGSGKSTLLKMLARIYGPTEGSCGVGGRLSSLLELGAGFHPEFSALENVYLSAAIYGIPREDIRRDIEGIIDFAELAEFAHQPVKTFSSGMYARLGFSVAMHVRPDVLLLDEVFAVGDEAFIQKCIGRIAEFRRDGGTMVLVTHDAATVERMCTRALYLRDGLPVMIGSAHDVITTYHSRLAAEDADHEQSHHDSTQSEAFSVDVTTTNASHSEQHVFTEGESVTLTVVARAQHDVKSVRLALTIRDDLDRELGMTWLDNVSFKAGVPNTFTIALKPDVLRAGHFPVDFAIRDINSGQTYFEAPAIEKITMLGQQETSAGPIQLGAVWSEST